MKIVVCPDSFKDSLTSKEAAKAIKEGILEANKNVHVEVINVADGGEGTYESIKAVRKVKEKTLTVIGPLKKNVIAKYGIIEEENAAIIETAECCGIQLVPISKRNPLITTTYGIGQLINHCLDEGIRKFYIGLGGSSTNDGGVGMLQALGVKVVNEEGKIIPLGGKCLNDIKRIELESIDKRIKECEFIVACDVDNPILGKNGATYIYGPQKGASTQMIKELEHGMSNYVTIIEKNTGKQFKNIKSLGAAGGLGFAFYLIGGKLVKGIDMILDIYNFDQLISDADYVITGEGKIDSQTSHGKTIYGIAKRCKQRGIKVIAMCGCIEGDISDLYNIGVTSVFSIINKIETIEEALRNAKKELKKLTFNIMNLISN